MKFKNAEPGLVWSRTLSILLSMNGDKSPFPCSHSGPTLQEILLQAVKKWTTE